MVQSWELSNPFRCIRFKDLEEHVVNLQLDFRYIGFP